MKISYLQLPVANFHTELLKLATYKKISYLQHKLIGFVSLIIFFQFTIGMYHFYSYYKIDWWTIYRVEFNIYLMLKSQTLVARTYQPPFSNFLFTHLFSIKFPYVFIISSLFPYFNLFVSIFIHSLIILTLNCMCRPFIIHKVGTSTQSY